VTSLLRLLSGLSREGPATAKSGPIFAIIEPFFGTVSDGRFLRGAIFFLVERNTIEEKEMHRRKALECGMLFELAVHMISILQEIVPKSITWYGKGHGTYERRNRRIEVVACITAKDGASLLRASTVMPGREAETFGAIELKVTEEIYHAESRETVEGTFPVLVVVGKGLPGDEGMTRDLKTVVLNFKDGASVTLDLDTYGISGFDQSTLQDAGYDQLEFNQRGINLALILAAQNHFCPGEGGNVFQPYAPALESVRILSEALRRAPAQPVGYGVPSATCRELLNELLLKSD
jgi:hypothetical protein